MDSKHDNNDVQLIILTILSCITSITFGLSNPYAKYLPRNHLQGSPIATLITHPAGWNLQLNCAFGKMFQFNNQDHFLTWEFKACGGSGIIPCQLATQNPVNLVCGKKNKKCRQKLMIPKPKLNDSGIYSCVLHKRDESEYNMVISRYHVEFVGKIKEPPVLLGEEPTNKSVVMLQQVALECQAISFSNPTSIKWLKRSIRSNLNISNQASNEIQYNNHSYHVIQNHPPIYPYFIKEATSLANGMYLSKLIIKKAQLQHTGFYTCLVMNTVDIRYREMYLTVLPFTAKKEFERKPPELVEDRPENVSTVIPQTATLECHVRSFHQPIVRWVRRIEQISFRTTNLSSSVSIEYINNSYQMLTWNNADQSYSRYYIDETGPEHDVYSSKLVFPVTSAFDTGYYACIVMNDMGIVHREVFLNVVPIFLSKEEGFPWMPNVVLLLIPVILTIMTITAFYQKCKSKLVNNRQTQHYLRNRVQLEPCKSKMFDPIKVYTNNKIY